MSGLNSEPKLFLLGMLFLSITKYWFDVNNVIFIYSKQVLNIYMFTLLIISLPKMCFLKGRSSDRHQISHKVKIVTYQEVLINTLIHLSPSLAGSRVLKQG